MSESYRLQHLQLPMTVDNGLSLRLMSPTYQLTTLAISVKENHDIAALLRLLSQAYTRSTLKNLHIDVQKSSASLRIFVIPGRAHAQLKLKNLTIENADIRWIFSEITNSIDVYSLQGLVLWRCIRADLVLAVLGNSNLSFLPLTCLAVSFEVDTTIHVSPILKRISYLSNINSLHILFEGLNPGPHIEPPSLLTSFSYHENDFDVGSRIFVVDESSEDYPFQSIVWKNLREIGIQAEERFLSPTISEFWVSDTKSLVISTDNYSHYSKICQV